MLTTIAMIAGPIIVTSLVEHWLPKTKKTEANSIIGLVINLLKRFAK